MPSSEEQDKLSLSQEQEILTNVETLERQRERKRLRLRPLGVSVAAALLATYVFAVIVVVATLYLHAADVRAWLSDDELFDDPLLWFVYVPISAVWAAILCYGLYNLQEWARHSLSATAFYGFIRRVYAAAVAPLSMHGFRGSHLETMVLSEAILLVLIAGYFQTSSVAAAFRSSLPQPKEL